MALTAQLKSEREALTRAQTLARSTKADPREAVEAEQSLPFRRSKIGKLEGAIDRRRARISEMDRLLREMRADELGSADHTLAIRHLEDAALRLKHELEGLV